MDSTTDKGEPARPPAGSIEGPRITARRAADGVLVVEIAGDWTGRSGLPDVRNLLDKSADPRTLAVTFDARGLGRWGSPLLVKLLEIHDRCVERNLEFRAASLPAGLARLIQLARSVAEKKDAARREIAAPVLQQIGESTLGAWAGAVEMLHFVGDCILALFRLIRGKAQFRWTDMLQVMQECGPQALPIVALINFLIGLILTFVGATELKRFGASVYTADLVAVATVREMACIMTGIILCGRTGAAFAAQLGTMKVNQEIEAFQTFGIAPIEFLVLPRMLALIVMMPLLCLFANVISISGGYLVSWLMLDVAPRVYWTRTVESIQFSSFLLGISKGAFFGVLIALSGCLRGIQCGTNAAAVGRATTSAVVTGITAIIASDGLFALFCSALGI